VRESLRRAEDRLAAVEGALLVALLATMVTLAFAQVVLRRFGAGLLWGETLLKHMVLWSGFLGAALAARAEKHFAWEAAHLGAPRRLKPWLRLLSSAAGALVCVALAHAGWRYAADARAAGEVLFSASGRTFLAWPAWAGIPVGFALVLVHLVFKAADAALEAREAREA